MSGIKNSEKKFLMFRNRPLVRCGNVLYYGDVKDRFVIEMDIKSFQKVAELKVAEKVAIRLIDTSCLNNPNKKIIKMSEKTGLYNSLDIACAWLDRALESTEQIQE